jgi:hypothetical protein
MKLQQVQQYIKGVLKICELQLDRKTLCKSKKVVFSINQSGFPSSLAVDNSFKGFTIMVIIIFYT